ncbi:MAG: acetylornithine deacetylase [Nitrososphaerota archaeon]
MNVEEIASQLISMQTEAPPGNEEECAAYLRDYLLDQKIENCEVILHRFAEKRANLVARIGPMGQAGLLLSGHIDVVPVGSLAGWDSHPFEPKIREGKLYGRGAADMKGGVAAIVKAIESTKNLQLKRGIVFVATAGEEIGFDGLRALIRDKQIRENDALFGVIGEPTNLRVVRAHKGGTLFRITFHGRSAHSSRPDLGVNAIENAARFIVELKSLRNKLEDIKDPDLGSSVISSTIIKGGVKENVIPASCQIIVDCRRIPSHSDKYILSELEQISNNLKASYGSFELTIEEIFSSDALNTPKDHPLVKMAEDLVAEESGAAPYGTEAPLYQQLGIPTIILGPGSVEQAHVINEYVEIKQLHRAEIIYKELVKRVCVK